MIEAVLLICGFLTLMNWAAAAIVIVFAATIGYSASQRVKTNWALEDAYAELSGAYQKVVTKDGKEVLVRNEEIENKTLADEDEFDKWMRDQLPSGHRSS